MKSDFGLWIMDFELASFFCLIQRIRKNNSLKITDSDFSHLDSKHGQQMFIK